MILKAYTAENIYILYTYILNFQLSNIVLVHEIDHKEGRQYLVFRMEVHYILPAPQENVENEHLRVLRVELHRKYKSGELDGYGLYL